MILLGEKKKDQLPCTGIIFSKHSTRSKELNTKVHPLIIEIKMKFKILLVLDGFQIFKIWLKLGEVQTCISTELFNFFFFTCFFLILYAI